MSKRYRRFQEKRARKRRHIVLMVTLTLLLAFSFLVVDLNSNQMLTGIGAVHVFSIQKQEGRATLYVFGKEIVLPFLSKKIVNER